MYEKRKYMDSSNSHFSDINLKSWFVTYCTPRACVDDMVIKLSPLMSGGWTNVISMVVLAEVT